MPFWLHLDFQSAAKQRYVKSISFKKYIFLKPSTIQNRIQKQMNCQHTNLTTKKYFHRSFIPVCRELKLWTKYLNILIVHAFLRFRYMYGIPNVDNALIYCKTCFKSKIFKNISRSHIYKSILHPMGNHTNCKHTKDL